MNTLEELTDIIISLANNNDKQFAKRDIRFLLSCHLDDVLKMVKNINETSLHSRDRFERILQLEAKFGVPKTHIL